MKNVLILILFFALVGGFFVWDTFLKEAGEIVSESEEAAETGEAELEEPEEMENQPEEKEENPPEKINQTKDYCSDPDGQLVHCLFEVLGVPSPKGVAFRPDGKEFWATSLLNKLNGVYVFNAVTGEKIKSINLNGGGGVEVIFSSDSKKAYISQMETGKVFEVDSESKEILRVFDTQSTWTKVLAFSSDEKTLFASNWCGDSVSEIDLETGELKRNIVSVDTPRGIYITKDNVLYIAGFENGEIQKVDLKTGLKEILYTSGGAMRHIAGDEEKGILYFSEMAQGKIFKFYLSTGEIEEFAETDVNPNTIALSPDKKILFVSCRGKNYSSDNYFVPGPEWGSVLLFDAETGDMLDAIVGGNQPTALDVIEGRMVFSDFLDGRIRVYKIPSYEELKEGEGRGSVYKEELHK